MNPHLAATRFTGKYASRLDDDRRDIRTGSNYTMGRDDLSGVVKAAGSPIVRLMRCPAATQTDRIPSGVRFQRARTLNAPGN